MKHQERTPQKKKGQRERMESEECYEEWQRKIERVRQEEERIIKKNVDE